MRKENPVLAVRDLSIERGGVLILDGISWCVRRGEHWAILGANGSGKTSLLSALAAYMAPTGGSIEVLGKRYGESDWRELRKNIGIVSSSVRQMMADDEPALKTIISGKYAMIDFWGRVEKKDRERAVKILRQIECTHLIERPWRVLSQGERQRILIGRALMARPRVLILDEPCAGLDPVARENFLRFVEKLGRETNAPALILVTHHVEEITPVFSHVFLLLNGRELASGPKKAVLKSKFLTEAYGAEIKVHATRGRYSLAISRSGGVAI